MAVENPNVPVAFALVIAAGFATALGAAVVFFPSLVKLASRKVLASGLGLSAGVMTYVSFVEIFSKSRKAFLNYGESQTDANLYATLCFFGGVGAMILLDMVVHLLTSGQGHGYDHSHHHHDPPENESHNYDSAADDSPDDFRHHHDPVCDDDGDDVYEVTQACFTCSHDPVGDLERLHLQAHEIIERTHVAAEHVHDGEASTTPAATPIAEDTETGQGATATKLAEEEQRKLIKMGINTAVAIGLHNFPEGLATFVAALDNPKVGAVLAVAIGIHNIPEGLCVALPIYYATGNRTKAFCWALLSGASEPVAALLGWAVLANSFSQQLFAILFGLVAGMMVIISTRELLPTAHRYDPDDTVVTFSFIVGMGIMALSLVLFTL